MTACDGAGVDVLRAQTEAHEGLDLTGESHYSVLEHGFEGLEFAQELEGVVMRGGALALKDTVNRLTLMHLWTPLDDAETVFETRDTRRIWGVHDPSPSIAPTDSGAIRCFPRATYISLAPAP